MNQRMSLLYKMDGLLKNCKPCDKNNGEENPEERCNGCQTYSELREIGNQLGRKKDMGKNIPSEAKYNELKKEGLKRPEIAEKMGIAVKTLDYHVAKWKKGNTKTSPKAIAKETFESVKQKVAEQLQGDPDLIKKLQGRIVELEEQVKGYPALMERASRLEVENMKLEENLKDESLSAYYYKKDLERAADQVEDLKDKLEGSYIESSKWEDRARLYARENENMDATNKHLREICEEQRRKSTAYLNLLKVVL